MIHGSVGESLNDNNKTSAALGVTAGQARVAAFQLHEAGVAAARAVAGARALGRNVIGAGKARQAVEAPAHEADLDHVALDDLANRSEQGGNIAAVHPLPATRIEDRLELFHDEGNVSAAPEHRRYHAGERQGPGIGFHVLGIDEDLEGPAAAVFFDV